jgi:hypothetical protein
MLAILRRRRAQALVEFALIVPFLTLLMLGGADLARAFYLSVEITGAARAGMRNGIQGTNNDIGDSTRAEPNTAIPNTAAAWGATGPGGVNDCDPAQPTHKCGDGSGCLGAWAVNQIACFAVRACTLNAQGFCSSFGAWQSRPAGGGVAPTALVVRAVYKFTPATPIIANFAGGPGYFLLIRESYGLELY